MKYKKRIDSVYKNALRLKLDDGSKYVFMSDCHRSDGSHADQFTPNTNLYHVALENYYDKGYTYIELGDGDELWETTKFKTILGMHLDTFLLLKKFNEANRFYMLYGNHDIVKGHSGWSEKNRFRYKRHCHCKTEHLLPGLPICEGIVLEKPDTGQELLLLHGHQADFFNDRLWRLSRWMVRHLWRPLELIGVKNPITPAKNDGLGEGVEKALSDYSARENKIIVAGHTHREAFPCPGQPPYFNDGCCVRPYYITAIEVENGSISLVKWHTSADKDGTLRVVRRTTDGPEPISSYDLSGGK